MNHQVKEFWETQADGYVGNYKPAWRGTNFNFRKRLEVVCQITRERGGTLLDCAAGTGEVTGAVLANGRFCEAVIADVSQPMLDVARRVIRAEDFLFAPDFVCADIFEFLARQPRVPRFDVVLCLGLIAHTGRLAEILRLCHPILKPGGIVVLQSSLLDHVGTRILRALSARRYRKKKNYAIQYFWEKDVRDAASDAGLAIISSTRFGVGIPYGDRICAPMNYWIERLFSGWAEKHGSDAIFVIGSPAHFY